MTSPIEFSQAGLDVLCERNRQISSEGWSDYHDDKHKAGTLALAAACYALHVAMGYATKRKSRAQWVVMAQTLVMRAWPWHRKWWKPRDQRRDLVRAGALIIAEIERLDRATAKSGKKE